MVIISMTMMIEKHCRMLLFLQRSSRWTNTTTNVWRIDRWESCGGFAVALLCICKDFAVQETFSWKTSCSRSTAVICMRSSVLSEVFSLAGWGDFCVWIVDYFTDILVCTTFKWSKFYSLYFVIASVFILLLFLCFIRCAPRTSLLKDTVLFASKNRIVPLKP